MEDLIYLGILAGCVAVTLGLVRLCAVLTPDQPSAGDKP